MTKPAHLEEIAWPALAVFGAQISVNIGAAVAKGLFPVVGAEGVAALRTTISALLLLAFWRPWHTRLQPHEFKNLIAYGAMLGLMNLLIYRAFAYIPIGVAVGIEVTGPLTVVLLSSRRTADFAWILCAALGLSLLLPLRQSANSLNPIGVAYALGAAVCWALYIVFGQRVSHLGSGQAVSWGMLVASAVTLPLGVFHAGTTLLAPGTLRVGLVVALLSSVLSFSLEMVGLKRLPRRLFSMLSSAGPAIGAVVGFFILEERLTLMQWSAIGCIMFACLGSAVTSPRGDSMEKEDLEKQEEVRVA